jgi:hypothetical protein
MDYPSDDGNIPIFIHKQGRPYIDKILAEYFTMSEPYLLCLEDNRKGDPDSMGPLYFYNLLFVGSNRRIKRRFDYSPSKYHHGTVTRKSAKFW